MRYEGDVTNMADRKYQFERLTPTDSVDLNVYGEAIDYVFDNPDIKNVAISGAYSAGKSSVLASYKKQHNDKRFLHISLAHFTSPDQEDELEIKESVLEGKILNQLIHQIPAEKIPQTNFRVKRSAQTNNVIGETLGFVLFVISIIFLTHLDTWKDYVSTLPDSWFKSILAVSTQQYASIVVGLIVVLLSALAVYRLIRIQKNKNVFRKLNLNGNEIEIFEESDDSYFDKYLNEVLYLFENADADAIVFEDMDRFNANRIFERLREVNTLANIQLQKENKKPLRFFYLLRDDIFVSKDRTKFFDYIIPVVPVVDSSNSYDQFITHLKKGGILGIFNEGFLQGLSLYIDDMRLLKNIYNEFIVYYNRINTTELNCNKMLAIITYKNLFPRDFADLQLNRGFVYTLFSKKELFIRSEVETIEKNIDDLKSKISSLKSEHLLSMRELNVVYADKFITCYSWQNQNDSYLSRLMDTLQGEGKREYLSRKQILEDKSNAKESDLQREILLLEQRLVEIKNKQLYQIITRDNIDRIFSVTSTNEVGEVSEFNEIKSSEYFDLLKFLVRNDFIDETYADYMTYFYGNSLSRTDKTFLRSITDKKAKEYTYQLKNTQLIVSRLRLVDFDQEETLNFDLLTYLLQSAQTNYIQRLVNQLKNTKNFKFIGAYFDITTETPTYVKNLNMGWPEVFSVALKEQALLKEQIYRYSICSLYYSDDDIIRLVNKENCLSNYISNMRNYLAIEDPQIDRLIHCFSFLGVCFKGFDYAELNQKLFFAVYEKSMYEINAENLQLIQMKILGATKEDFFHKNYTLLYLNPDSAIAKYVSQNINEYFNNVVLEVCGGAIYDDEKAAITALNNPDLSIEHKLAYISSLQTTITAIKDIVDSSLWSSLLDADIVCFSEGNIMDCFNTMQLNESVVSYINNCDIDLDFSRYECDEDTRMKLFNSIVSCNDIENAKYRQILASFNFYSQAFNISGISNDKVTILIDTNIIIMTEDALKFMRENYPSQTLYFIYKNIEKYVDIVNETLFSQEELLEILTWDIDDELKIRLLILSRENISIIGKNYSPSVCLHILNNCFAESDLPDLFSSFEYWDISIQAKIFDFAVGNIAKIINAPNSVSEKLKDNLLRSEKVKRDERIDLFIALMPDLSVVRIKEVLVLFNLTDYLKILETRSRPKFEINDENEKLLAAFKAKKLIYAYEKCPERDGYYKVVRHRPAAKQLPDELL